MSKVQVIEEGRTSINWIFALGYEVFHLSQVTENHKICRNKSGFFFHLL